MRSRHAVLPVLLAAAGFAAGCGGDSVADELPEDPPTLTAPPSGGTSTSAASATTTTSTTSTTSTTDAAAPTADPGTTGGTAVTPAAPVAPTPAPTDDTGGAVTPAPEPTTPEPTTPDPSSSGGADFNEFCAENPGAC